MQCITIPTRPTGLGPGPECVPNPSSHSSLSTSRSDESSISSTSSSTDDNTITLRITITAPSGITTVQLTPTTSSKPPSISALSSWSPPSSFQQTTPLPSLATPGISAENAVGKGVRIGQVVGIAVGVSIGAIVCTFGIWHSLRRIYRSIYTPDRVPILRGDRELEDSAIATRTATLTPESILSMAPDTSIRRLSQEGADQSREAAAHSLSVSRLSHQGESLIPQRLSFDQGTSSHGTGVASLTQVHMEGGTSLVQEHLDCRDHEMSRLLPGAIQEIAPRSGGTQPRYEVDGGVRLVGVLLGRVPMVGDQRSDIVGSTLPPPYSEY